MENPVEFLKNTYSQADLEGMSIEDLLSLRNLVADNLNVAKVKGFKDHETAVTQTGKALERFATSVAEAKDEAGEPVKKAKKTKAPKEPKEYKLAKSAEAKIVKRPTRKMFSTIAKTGEHDGAAHGRARRWDAYKDGMTMVDIMETEGTEPWDVHNWVDKGIMTITEPTEDEYKTRRAAWYTKHNLEDPELKKERQAEERIAAKAAREKKVAEKKAAKEATAKQKALDKAAKEKAA